MVDFKAAAERAKRDRAIAAEERARILALLDDEALARSAWLNSDEPIAPFQPIDTYRAALRAKIETP